jgi:hypothetical protein
LKELAEQEGISINQLINTALSEKISALMTQEYLNVRAKRGSRIKFRKALSKVRDRSPDHKDKFDS